MTSISIVDAEFAILPEDEEAVLGLVRRWWNEFADDRGGLDDADLDEAFESLGFGIGRDLDDEINSIELLSDTAAPFFDDLGKLFSSITRFVSRGSYIEIEVEGVDDSIRWDFDEFAEGDDLDDDEDDDDDDDDLDDDDDDVADDEEEEEEFEEPDEEFEPPEL